MSQEESDEESQSLNDPPPDLPLGVPESEDPPEERFAEVHSSEAFYDQDYDNKLPFFYASMFATVIEDVLLQLRILGECNNELRMRKTSADIQYWKAVKFGVAQANKKHELDYIDPTKLTCDQYKLDKLESDRKFLETVFLGLYKDMALKNMFQALVFQINKRIAQDEYLTTVMEEESRTRYLKREAAKQLRQQRNHFKSVIYDSDVKISELKTQVEDAALMSEIRSRYVENWQNARTEQHLQVIFDKEKVPNDVIEYHKVRLDHEERVHTELELMMNIRIRETLEKVEEWMERYEKDMENMDVKIQMKKNEYQNILDKRKNLEQTIIDHEELMKQWVAFKDERERVRQYRLKMTNAALTVQAWWRGLLVRKQLGPYRPKKKPPAGKKYK